MSILHAWKPILALWTAATAKEDADRAAQWQKQATAAVAYLERIHGPYWGRRAELELLRVAGSGSGDSNVEILARTADNLYLKDQFEEAITTYERAAGRARAGRDLPSAFALEYKAALIEQQLQRFTAAAQRLRRLALEQTTDAEYPKRHLRAAWNQDRPCARPGQHASV